MVWVLVLVAQLVSDARQNDEPNPHQGEEDWREQEDVVHKHLRPLGALVTANAVTSNAEHSPSLWLSEMQLNSTHQCDLLSLASAQLLTLAMCHPAVTGEIGCR